MKKLILFISMIMLLSACATKPSDQAAKSQLCDTPDSTRPHMMHKMVFNGNGYTVGTIFTKCAKGDACLLDSSSEICRRVLNEDGFIAPEKLVAAVAVDTFIQYLERES